MAGGPLELWNHRSMQILVLLSLGLQFVLFVFAGTRRGEGAPIRRLRLWLAYLMADSTAVYALGHLSLSASMHDSQLVTFWGPFLLLHLGGPDNITALALQDNQLWPRHLQTLVVQVLGAAYVLKKNILGSGKLLRLASFLMFGLGVVKYGERTWALKCGTLESIGVSAQTQPPAIHNHFHPDDGLSEEEFYVRRAHSLFHVCKRAIVDSSVIERGVVESHREYTTKLMDRVELWALMEIELSLMYDLLYTKASVVYTSFGYVVRVISPVTAAASLVLFLLTGKDGHNRDDIAITYVLLAGAVFMETTSLVNALGSSWTFAFLITTRWRWLRYTALCNKRWDRLRLAVVSVHNLVKGGGSRYKSRRWSYTIGQYNMLHYCTRPADGPLTSPLLGTIAKKLGLGEWWNRKHYSGSTKLSSWISRSITDYMRRLYSRGKFSVTARIGMKWGMDPLERRRGIHGQAILKDTLGVEFQEGIIIWHIGTHVFLTKSERAKADGDAPTVEAIKVLSDYMMFLLVERPYMLPGQPPRNLYKRTCEKLVSMRSASPRRRGYGIKNMFRVHDGPSSSSSRAAAIEELADNLYHEYVDKEFSLVAPRLTHVAQLAKQLLEMERDGHLGLLELVLDVWMDILVYASTKCSRNSHAQKLNSGGEMTTIVWLLAEHLYRATTYL